ncbi:MAG: hypothetical protein ACPGJF_04475 [Sinimarinibacterium flocculans]|uniref:hypothetical protein n=1 Tax=Sinimarinibacterium flocculans TaxID=985250 RepID=UPI003C6A81FA
METAQLATTGAPPLHGEDQMHAPARHTLIALSAVLIIAPGRAMSDDPPSRQFRDAAIQAMKDAPGNLLQGAADVLLDTSKWVYITPSSKETCLERTDGQLNEDYLLCRNGGQAKVVKQNGQYVIVDRRINRY